MTYLDIDGFKIFKTSFEETKDNKGKDTFDLPDWWKFIIFNETYNDDQKKSHTDNIEFIHVVTV